MLQIYYGDQIVIDNKVSKIIYCDINHVIDNYDNNYINTNLDIKIFKRNVNRGVIETHKWHIGDILTFTNKTTNETMIGTIYKIEKDMIVIKTDIGMKYIDFEYKGIPPWLNIQHKKKEYTIKLLKINSPKKPNKTERPKMFFNHFLDWFRKK